MNAVLDMDRHPCFKAEVKGVYGRAHLPVALKCNIKCNYCNRKYDCCERKPSGRDQLRADALTSGQLYGTRAGAGTENHRGGHSRTRRPVRQSPGNAGDHAFAEETVSRLTALFVHQRAQLSPLPGQSGRDRRVACHHHRERGRPGDRKEDLRLDQDGKVVYRGLEGAKLLLDRQIESIKGLKKHGITVKVNTIVIPGINDGHVPEVAKKMKSLGVDLLNCMPMYPNADTVFENIPEPGAKQIAAIRKEAEKYLPQMRHCQRCRADAVGLLEQDRSGEFRGCLSDCSDLKPDPEQERPYVAVASLEGMLINQHLGEAERFLIWRKTDQGFEFVEERTAPQAGTGPKRWYQLAEILKDCRAALASAAGDTPTALLGESGLQVLVATGFIESALKTIYNGGSLSTLQGRRRGLSKGCCSGGGEGCS